MTIRASDLHWLKHDSPIDFKEDDDDEVERNFTCNNDEQPWKEVFPTSVTDDGIFICGSEEQSLKTDSSIFLIEFGRFICESDEHPSNAL